MQSEEEQWEAEHQTVLEQFPTMQKMYQLNKSG